MRMKSLSFPAFVAAAYLCICDSPLRAQIITDLLVNDEPDSVTFSAQTPSLHVFSPDKFLVVWQDDRTGGFSAWANFFNVSGQSLSDDFPILGGEHVSPKTASRYTVIQHRTEPTSISLEDDWVGYRQNYKDVTPIDDVREMDRFGWPWCGTGFLGVGSDLVRTNWGSLYVVKFDGEVWYRFFNQHDSEIGHARRLNDAGGLESNYGALAFSLAASPDSARVWMICYLLGDWGMQVRLSMFVGELSAADDTGAFHFVMADSVLFTYENGMRFMHTLAVDDSTLTHLFVKSDSLFEMRLRVDGTIVERHSELIPPPDWPGVDQVSASPAALLISNVRDESRKLAIAGFQYGMNGGKSVARSFAALYDIGEGHIVDFSPEIIALDEGVFLANSGEAFLTPERKVIMPAIIEREIHLLELGNGAAQIVAKVSDPPLGANQSSPRILLESDTGCWISWLELNRPRARRLDSNGNLIDAAQPLPATDGLFLQNGERFITFVPSSDSSRLGLADVQIWQVDGWRLLDTVPLDQRPSTFLHHRIDHTGFFLYSRQDSLGRIDRYDAAGLKTGTLSFARNTSSYRSFAITPLPDGRFWLCAGDYYLWNPSTMSVHGPVRIPSTDAFYPITPDRFVVAHYGSSTPTEPYVKFSLRDTAGATLVEDIALTNEYMQIHAVLPLRDDHFLILLQHNGLVLAQVFDRDFNALQSPFQPFPNATLMATLPRVAAFDERVVFAVNDIRPEGIGSDIFASVYDLKTLITTVEVKNESSSQPRAFALLALSPNPLRTGEVLRVDLSLESGRAIELRLYNLVGQMIHQFELKQMAMGSHAIRLDLPPLPAGVYFLQAKSDGRAAVKKLVVML